MSDLDRLFMAQQITRTRTAEWECAIARRELAEIRERQAYLISQALPLAELDVDREQFRLLMQYLGHGDMARLYRGMEELKESKR